MIRCRNILLIVALLAATDTHWAALQSIAWMRMLAQNLREESLPTAITHTFDGKHLCPLCKAIATAKKSEKKTEIAQPKKRIDFLPSVECPVLVAPAHFQFVPVANNFVESVSHKPLTPPPRATCA